MKKYKGKTTELISHKGKGGCGGNGSVVPVGTKTNYGETTVVSAPENSTERKIIWDETNSGSGMGGAMAFYQHPETIHIKM